MEELLTGPTPGLLERIRYKTSFEMVSELERFILYVENNYFKAADVRLTKHITLPSEFIAAQFRRFDRYPMRRRFEVMTDYIVERVQLQYRITVTTAERRLLGKEIRNRFAGHDDIQLYKDFFAWIGKPELFKMRKNRMLEYTDLAPLAYLHLALEGNSRPNRVGHLLIDEMQDYSPIQYKVIQKLYPCRKTVLGDTAQAVTPYGSSTAAIIQKAFVTGEVMKLCKSYRSTYEITGFAQRIRANDELEPIVRHGEQPRIFRFETEEDEISGIAILLSAFRESAYQSLGIVCKTESQAQKLAAKLQAYPHEVHFLSSRSSAFVRGIIVTSAHMAKGLEFDEIIVPHANAENYCSEMDRNMLYIAVTRAMHKLTLTYTGTQSRFFQ